MLTPKIISVEALEKYKIKVVFADELQGVYDVSDLAGTGVFKIWDIDDNFFKVFINQESGAISWRDEIEIDTINTYCTLKRISPDHFFHNQMKYAHALVLFMALLFGCIGKITIRLTFMQPTRTLKY